MATFEEIIPVGKEFVSPGRTIGEGEFSLLHSLTWDIGSVHCDKEFMKGTQFGERILTAACVLACVQGLAIAGGLRATLYDNGVRPVAVLGFDEVRFTAPVMPGDTIKVRWRFLGVRPTRKNPRRGVVQIRYIASKQNGQEVMSYTSPVMVERTA